MWGSRPAHPLAPRTLCQYQESDRLAAIPFVKYLPIHPRPSLLSHHLRSRSVITSSYEAARQQNVPNHGRPRNTVIGQNIIFGAKILAGRPSLKSNDPTSIRTLQPLCVSYYLGVAVILTKSV